MFIPPFFFSSSSLFNKEEVLAPWKRACSNDCLFPVTYSGIVWALCRQRRKKKMKMASFSFRDVVVQAAKLSVVSSSNHRMSSAVASLASVLLFGSI